MYDYEGLITLAQEAGLEDAEIGTLVCAISRYARTGIAPAFTDPALNLVFLMARPAVDAPRASAAPAGALAEKRRQAGAAGGRAKARNAKARTVAKSSKNVAKSSKTDFARDLLETSVHDSCTDVRTDVRTNSFKNLKNSESVSQYESEQAKDTQEPLVLENERRAAPLADTRAVIGAAEVAGMKISPRQAELILRSKIPKEWLKPPWSFLSFVAERLRRKYPQAPPYDFQRLFLAAACNKRRRNGEDWSDLRDEYSMWLDERCAASAAARARQECERKERAETDAKRERWKNEGSPPLLRMFMDMKGLTERVEYPAETARGGHSCLTVS